MGNKYLVLAAIVLVVFVVGVSLVAFSQAEKIDRIRIGYTPIAAQLPLFAAVENGYFEEEGLEFELVMFEAPNQVNDAIMQGKIDVTCPAMALGIFAMADYKNPGKIKIYDIGGGSMKSPISKVLVHKDSDIDSVTELKGKRFGIWGGTIQWITIAKNYLEENGLIVYENVEIVELPPALQVQALASKQIDALLALEPMSTVALEQGVAKVLDATPVESTINEDSWIGAGAINIAYAQRKPELVEKYIKVIKKGIEFVEENPEAARQYMPKYTPMTDNLAQNVPLLQYKTCEEISEKDLEGMQNFYDKFTKYGFVDGQIDAKALLYCDME